MRREIYAASSRLYGRDNEDTIIDAFNLAESLMRAELFGEAKTISRKTIPDARRALGADHDLTLVLRKVYADCVCHDTSASREDVAKAVAILEDVQQRVRRVFGDGHPNWRNLPAHLEAAREFLEARDKLASFDT